MRRGLSLLLLLCAAFAQTVAGKVYVRWTQSTLPPAKLLGVKELVIPWNDGATSLMEAAKRQGYHIYLEATLEQAATAAEAGVKAGAAGIMLRGTATEQSQVEESTHKLRAQYPKLKILPLSAGGKQPEMRGWLVFNKNGILQVSSPSAQPWLDQNLATVRQERAFDGGRAPIYTFTWDEAIRW